MKAQKFTLLIVEDDEDERFFLKKAFEGLGIAYKVQLAGDGEETIAYPGAVSDTGGNAVVFR